MGAELPPTYRALRAVLHVVHGQLHLRVLADVGVLEEGDAAEEGGVVGALRTQHNRFVSRSSPRCDVTHVGEAA